MNALIRPAGKALFDFLKTEEGRKTGMTALRKGGEALGKVGSVAGRVADACGTECRWGWFWTSMSGCGLASSSSGQSLMLEGSCFLLSLRTLPPDRSRYADPAGTKHGSASLRGIVLATP